MDLESFFDGAMRLVGYLLVAFLVLTVGCAVAYILLWGVVWSALGG